MTKNPSNTRIYISQDAVTGKFLLDTGTEKTEPLSRKKVINFLEQKFPAAVNRFKSIYPKRKKNEPIESSNCILDAVPPKTFVPKADRNLPTWTYDGDHNKTVGELTFEEMRWELISRIKKQRKTYKNVCEANDLLTEIVEGAAD